jgi:acid phosphatase (class A)
MMTKLFLLLSLYLTFTLNMAEAKSSKYETILGFPPAEESVEEDADFDVLMDFQKNRSKQDCALAAQEEKMSLENLFGGAKGPLSEKEVKKHKFFYWKYFIKAGLPSTSAKKHFKRPRPFERFSEIKPCIKLPDSYSYPSGHTSVSRVMAYALARKYPERAALFFKRADEIARNRMLGGVHYPTDIRSGKVLGDYLINKFFKDKQFMKDLMKE